jgi:ketosteroid isomerase-like protein
MSIPIVIWSYFEAAEKHDTDAVIALFATDAIVEDEDHSWSGSAGIRGWRDGTATKYEYTTEVLGIDPTGDEQYIAQVHLEGNFPGGKVDLKYSFTIANDRIARLQITP